MQKYETLNATDQSQSLVSPACWDTLLNSAKPRLLLVTHRWGGGCEKHVSMLANILSDLFEVLIMKPASRSGVSGEVELCWYRYESRACAFFAFSEEVADPGSLLIEALREIKFDRVHIHHVIGFPSQIIDLPGLLALPYDLTLHDYYPACPQYSLISTNGTYCGEPSETGCAACLAERPAQWNMSIVQWRGHFSEFLAGAKRIFVPSADMQQRLKRYFPDCNFIHLIHPESVKKPPRNWLRVITPGRVSPSKGLNVIKECAKHSKETNANIFFRILGSTTEAVDLWPALPLSIHGEYKDEHIADLINIEKPDAIFLPVQVPETFSYVLSEAMRANLPIVASALGSFCERLAGYPHKTLLPWNSSPQDWNQAIEAITGEKQTASAPTPDSITSSMWLARYLEGIELNSSKAAHRNHVPPNALIREAKPSPYPLLKTLYNSGVNCGQNESLNELSRRIHSIEHNNIAPENTIEKLDARAQTAEQETRELQRYNENLKSELVFRESELEAARDRVNELESSTSWRVTQPLRWAGTQQQEWRVKGRRFARHASQLPRQSRIARQLLREEGAVTVLKRVKHKLALREQAKPALSQPVYRLADSISSLQFKQHAQPTVSIVIPVYGEHLQTFTCLQSIAEHTAGIDYDILLMDDCSPQPASAALAQVEGINIERNDQNIGFLRNANKGIRLARSEIVVLLNNDTIVCNGWLDALLDILNHRADAGLVGAKLIYPNGSLQEAGGIVWRDGSAWNYGRGDNPDDPSYNYVRKVDYCSGACLAFRKELFLELGGFGEEYAPAYYEDTDFAFKVRKAGKQVYYQPAAQVVHFEGVTCGKEESSGIKRYQAINQKTFENRWSSALSKHRINGAHPELEKDRGTRYRVLIIDAYTPTPDQDSGSVRMTAIMEGLRDLDAKVYFVADNLEYRHPYSNKLQQLGVETLHHPFIGDIDEFLQTWGGDFNLIVASRHYVAGRHIKAIRKYAPQALLVFDTVDLHYLREERLAKLEESQSLTKAAAATRKQELAVVAQSDITLVVSPVEKDVLTLAAPEADVRVLSNIHHVAEHTAPFSRRKDILFIGGFRHPPNIDAVQWYCNEVWPRIYAALPHIVTRIVGSNMPEKIKKLSGNGIDIVGFVEDIEPLLQESRVSVAPLRYGAGVKGKVNMSMSRGLPVVATSTATEGTGLLNGINVLTAESAEDFAAAVIRLHTDCDLWTEISSGGIENVRENFSTTKANTTLSKLLALSASLPRHT